MRFTPFIAGFSLLPLLVSGQEPVVPVLSPRIPLVRERVGGERTIDLGNHFQFVEVLDEVVRFTTTYDVEGTPVTENLDFLLFADATPVTRDNFLGYVDRGDYVNSIVHRVARNFVVQGGGFTAMENPDGGEPLTGLVPVQAPILNEFSISNTEQTISMAKRGGNPNSATSQWFISLATNSNNLDNQNGGFTVFGRITNETYPNARGLNDPSKFRLETLPDPVPGDDVPFEENSPRAGFNLDDLYLFDSVTREPIPPGQVGTSVDLAYRILDSDSSPFYTLNLDGSQLDVRFSEEAISRAKDGTVIVEAEDSVGNTVREEVRLQISLSYPTWREFFFQGADFNNDAISGPLADPDDGGVANLTSYALGFEPNEDDQARIFEPIFFQSGFDLVIGMPVARLLDDVVFTLEQSETLEPESWQAVPSPTLFAQNPSGIDPRADNELNDFVAFRIPSPGPANPRLFYRISFSLTE